MSLPVKSSSRHFVYILRCRGNRLYCGYSNEPLRRFAVHCSGGGANFTRAFPPEEMVACVEMPSKSEALRLEATVKAMKRPDKLRWINAVGVSNPEY